MNRVLKRMLDSSSTWGLRSSTYGTPRYLRSKPRGRRISCREEEWDRKVPRDTFYGRDLKDSVILRRESVSLPGPSLKD